MLKTKLLLITIAIIGFSSKAYAEDLTTIREIKPNNISLGLDIFPFQSGTNTSAYFLNVGYNRNLNKNFSLGVNAKTFFGISNNINASGRYYFDWLNDRSHSFYVQADLGYLFASNPVPTILQSTPNSNTTSNTSSYVILDPTIGYEFRSENGFTFNADIGPRLSYGFSPSTTGQFVVAPVKLGAKVGYSF